MKKIILALLTSALFNPAAPGKPVPAPDGNFAVREIHYAARLADDEARLTVDLETDATGAGAVKILEGDVAVLPSKLPDALKIVRNQNSYLLVASRAGGIGFEI